VLLLMSVPCYVINELTDRIAVLEALHLAVFDRPAPATPAPAAARRLLQHHQDHSLAAARAALADAGIDPTHEAALVTAGAGAGAATTVGTAVRRLAGNSMPPTVNSPLPTS
jgi:hypothetical protein